MPGKTAFVGMLKCIFHVIQESPAVLAEFYLDRDRTLVYKWLRGTASPPKKLIPHIVRFVTEHSTDAMRTRLRADLTAELQSAFSSEQAEAICACAGFEEFLTDALLLALAERKEERLPVPSDTEQPLPAAAAPGEAAQAPTGTKGKPVKPVKPVLAETLYALAAALLGGGLWSLLTSLPSLAAYAVPSGFPAFVWGAVCALPIAFFALLCLYRSRPSALESRSILLAAGLYTLAGGLSGLLFYGLGVDFAALFVSPVLAQAFSAFTLSLIYSFLPLMCALLPRALKRIEPRTFLAMEFAPAFLCALASALLLLLGAGAALNAFLTGAALRLMMYFSLRAIWIQSPGRIALRLRRASADGL
ncbi:MAG: hypothetical protein AAGU74_05275 [Bacillota bacterium]